jgi:maleylacetate reductase
MERVAHAIGAEHAPSGLFDLAHRMGAPTALRRIGFRAEDLDEAVALVVEHLPAANPRPVGEAEIRGVLEGALEGRRPSP